MVVRLSISVPDELKAEMDNIETRVNWSAIAQSAFAREIGLQKRLEVGEMEQVVERLRASKEKSVDYDFDLGKKNGGEFAQKYADYSDLRKINEIDVDNLSESDKDLNLRFLVDALWGSEVDRWEVEGFLESHLSADRTSAAEIKGFVVGVQDVWDQVADKL